MLTTIRSLEWRAGRGGWSPRGTRRRRSSGRAQRSSSGSSPGVSRTVYPPDVPACQLPKSEVALAQPTTAADQEVVFLADGIDLVRDSRLLLNQVSFTVRSGEHWALLGPNGAGKSTLLRLLATYAHPTRGRIDILGRRLVPVDVFALQPLIAQVS